MNGSTKGLHLMILSAAEGATVGGHSSYWNCPLILSTKFTVYPVDDVAVYDVLT